MNDPALLDVLRPVLAVWFFALGGAVGSFLNVVVYRLPLGLSLIYPGSHCPHCKHPIRWHDNLPILGWLLLGGHCRDCGANIAARYPAVEAFTAVLFLAVALMEVLSMGANLPRLPIAVSDGWIYPGLGLSQSIGLGFYHLLLLSTILPAGLIEYDGQQVPWRLVAPVLTAGLLAPLAWPFLHPVPAWIPSGGSIVQLMDVATGFMVGMLLGLGSWAIGPRRYRTLLLLPACVGVCLGWQAVAILAPLVLALHGLARLGGILWPALRRISPGIWWLVATFAWLTAWKVLVDWYSSG